MKWIHVSTGALSLWCLYASACDGFYGWWMFIAPYLGSAAILCQVARWRSEDEQEERKLPEARAREVGHGR